MEPAVRCSAVSGSNPAPERRVVIGRCKENQKHRLETPCGEHPPRRQMTGPDRSDLGSEKPIDHEDCECGHEATLERPLVRPEKKDRPPEHE